MNITQEQWDEFLYSKGVYYLFEHWQEDKKNIYSKCKYQSKDDLLKGVGKILNTDQLNIIESGKGLILDQPDGTTFFFKFVNNP